MSNVRVPQVKVSVAVEGSEIARFEFNRTERSTQDWEITAALIDRDCKQAVRACLLASVSELSADGWEAYTFEPESGNSEDDQLELPF